MRSPLCTWQDLLAAPGELLVVMNVAADAVGDAAALFDRLESRIRASSLFVIAEPSWISWLAARGVPRDRVVPALDVLGQPLELNHFLESPAALQTIRLRACATIIGVAPHSLHNDEIKLPFEERICLCLDQGVLAAHTLPHDYVYLFDLPMLVRRLGRGSKLAAYEATCGKIVNDWYTRWDNAGRPDANAASPDAAALIGALRRHWPPAEAAEREERLLETGGDDSADASLPSIMYLQRVIAARDNLVDEMQQRLDDVRKRYEERVNAVEVREALLIEKETERVQAVQIRDEIIDNLRRRQLKSRIRRLLGKKP